MNTVPFEDDMRDQQVLRCLMYSALLVRLARARPDWAEPIEHAKTINAQRIAGVAGLN